MSVIISNMTIVQSIKQFFSSPQITQLINNIVYIALILIAVWLFFVIAIKILRLIRYLKEPFSFLEIVPPVNTEVSTQ